MTEDVYGPALWSIHRKRAERWKRSLEQLEQVVRRMQKDSEMVAQGGLMAEEYQALINLKLSISTKFGGRHG